MQGPLAPTGGLYILLRISTRPGVLVKPHIVRLLAMNKCTLTDLRVPSSAWAKSHHPSCQWTSSLAFPFADKLNFACSCIPHSGALGMLGIGIVVEFKGWARRVGCGRPVGG